MFVQLFLRKENCIIPLDQAAKQLIQMEESENEEDRLLKSTLQSELIAVGSSCDMDNRLLTTSFCLSSLFLLLHSQDPTTL